jgi:nitrate reductase NapE component
VFKGSLNAYKHECLNQRLFLFIFFEKGINPVLMLSISGGYGGDCPSDGLPNNRKV